VDLFRNTFFRVQKVPFGGGQHSALSPF